MKFIHSHKSQSHKEWVFNDDLTLFNIGEPGVAQVFIITLYFLFKISGWTRQRGKSTFAATPCDRSL